jgi:hypothetical protein
MYRLTGSMGLVFSNGDISCYGAGSPLDQLVFDSDVTMSSLI